jgi:hypothetical protein
LFCCCKNDRNINEQEVYRYNESILEYSFDIYSKNEFDRIVFLLDQDKKGITVMLYEKNENYKNFVIKISENKAEEFTKILNDQMRINTVFNKKKNKNRNGYDIVFSIDAGGSCLSANYSNTENFKEDISIDFDNFIVFLRKEKEVNSFFEQKIK